jgi:hypothetical protein
MANIRYTSKANNQIGTAIRYGSMTIDQRGGGRGLDRMQEGAKVEGVEGVEMNLEVEYQCETYLILKIQVSMDVDGWRCVYKEGR